MSETVFPRVWVFNSNRRVYPPAPPGQKFSQAPIYRHHWEERKIVGETRVSWILEYGERVPKKGRRDVLFSEQAVEDDTWRYDNRYRISREIEKCEDVALLRRIAELLGMKA